MPVAARSGVAGTSVSHPQRSRTGSQPFLNIADATLQDMTSSIAPSPHRGGVAAVAVALLAALALLAAIASPAGAITRGRSSGGAPPEIVGGQTAAVGEFPYQVALLDHSEPDTYWAQFCGGSLIGPSTVLTAAHCVEGTAPGQLDVLVRTIRLNNTGVRKPVARIIPHPQYNANTSAYDFAIIKLRSPVTNLSGGLAGFIPIVAPTQAALWSPGRTATVTGWGLTSDGGDASTVLRKVSVPVVSDTACRNAYGRDMISSVMVCAGQTGRDACQGDSGGPLAVRNGAGWVQIGVVSWGEGCGDAGFPGVYSEVAAVRPWILANVT